MGQVPLIAGLYTLTYRLPGVNANQYSEEVHKRLVLA